MMAPSSGQAKVPTGCLFPYRFSNEFGYTDVSRHGNLGMPVFYQIMIKQ